MKQGLFMILFITKSCKINLADNFSIVCRGLNACGWFLVKYHFHFTGVLLSAFPLSVDVISNDSYIVGGENLTLSCQVGFLGWSIPSIRWKLNDRYYICCGSFVTKNDDATYRGMKVRVSQLTITVPLCAEYLPKYSCHVRLLWMVDYYNHGHSPNNYTRINFRREYTWTTPKIKVSCEYNATFSSLNGILRQKFHRYVTRIYAIIWNILSSCWHLNISDCWYCDQLCFCLFVSLFPRVGLCVMTIACTASKF